MITITTALDLVREQLRAEVLPRLDKHEDYARSVLIAAIGVLGEVKSRARDDDSWCETSSRRLEPAIVAWTAQLPSRPELTEKLTELVGRSRTAPTARARRALLLEAAETMLTALWSAPQLPGSDAFRAELHELLAADNELEAQHGRSV